MTSMVMVMAMVMAVTERSDNVECYDNRSANEKRHGKPSSVIVKKHGWSCGVCRK
jgi:hypothetical protein